MSRFKKAVGALALMVVTGLLGLYAPAPAYATDWPQPIASDACGTTKDQFYTPAPDNGEDLSWKDSNGTSYSAGTWNSTGGAASITLTVKRYTLSGVEQHTYAPLTFGIEPDANCVEAADTVTTRIVACNPSNNGTRVTFTYTNTDDATDRYHTGVQVNAEFWDDNYANRDASILLEAGNVADGQSVSVTGGDADRISQYNGYNGQFRLYPGTYRLPLYGQGIRPYYLPNTLFIPACGTSQLVPGDPHGNIGGGHATVQPQPTGKIIAKQRGKRQKVVMYRAKGAGKSVFKVVVNPKKGKTTTKRYTVTRQQKVVWRTLKHRGDRVMLYAKVKNKHNKYYWKLLDRKVRRGHR